MPELKHLFSYILTPLLFLLILSAGCNNSPNTSEDKSIQTPVQELSERPRIASFESKLISDSIVNKLPGKWLRSDGAYVIEIFSVAKEGKMDAGYFNPNPIHVDKAEWKINDNELYIRMILKDVNYPGSTYTLRYNSGNETLAGNYFQAVEGTNFDVVFTRNK